MNWQALGLKENKEVFFFLFFVLEVNILITIQVLLKQSTLFQKYLVSQYTYNTCGSVHLDRQSSSINSSSSKISRIVSLKTLRSVSSSDKLKKEQAEGQ